MAASNTTTSGINLVSFSNTPQAKDDVWGATEAQLESGVLYIDVMLNDLGGGAKKLYSIDDGTEAPADFMKELALSDAGIGWGGLENTTAKGAALCILNGKVAIDAQRSPGYLDTINSLAAGETFQDSFVYAIQMGNGTLAWARVHITITGTNDGPIAHADTATGDENQVLTIDVLANDTDADHGASLSVVAASAPVGQGSATVVDNKVVFNPGSDFDHLKAGATATVTLSYTIADEHGAQSSSTVTITVTGTNDGPVAHADTAAGGENEALTIDVLANDTDADDDHVLSVTAASVPTGQGSATIVDNKVVFNPGTDFDHLKAGATATVTLSYTIADEHGAESSSTVTITVTGTNDAPVAHADTAAGGENESLTINVLANDTDADDDHVLSVTAASVPTGQGSATVVDNKVVFNPGSDFDHLKAGATATVTLSYTIADEHGAESSSTVTITVTGTNDAPVARADTAAGGENETLTINVLANDTDADDDHVLTVTAASVPSGQGSATVVDNKVVFNPGTDFDYLKAGATATVTLIYTIADEHGAESSSTVTITVTGTNDTPVAHADTAAGGENETLTIDVLANDTDDDDDHVLTVTAASVPAGQGSVTVVDNKVVFNPGTDFDHLKAGATATVTLSYTVADEHGAEASSTVTISVTGTNDGPVAHADTAAGGENESLTIDVLANDTDDDDDHVLTVTAASVPTGQGSATVVDNKVVFNPGTDFDHLKAGATASVTLSYTIADEHGAESSSTVTITVTGTNDTPVAHADTAAGGENETLTIDVLANDTDDDDDHVLTVTAASVPTGQGSATVVDNKVVFNPGSDFDHLKAGATATVTLSYTIADEHGAESSSTVTITVTGTNDAPVAHADTAAGGENESLTIDVLANDTDDDDDHVLTVTAASVPAGQGSATVVDNKVVFNPGTDFDHLKAGATASVTLSYTIADEHGAESSSTVTITVTGTNDAPVAHADTAAGGENESLTIDVLANDTDADADHVLTVTAASVPDGQGSAAVVDNKVVFNPGADFDHLKAGATATVTLSYTIADEHGAEASSTVTITVTGTNDGPVAHADTAAGHENETLTINVLANDTDADDDHVLTVTAASAPTGQGSATVVDNKVVFNPGTDFDYLKAGATATVTLSYTIADEHGTESSSTVAITVTGTNDIPTIAGAASGSVTEDQDVVGGKISTSGSLTIVDKDQGESSFAAQSHTGTYGSFTLDSAGLWTYVADNGQTAIQQLNSGQSITDSFTSVSSDGTASQVVTVTIHGVNEPVTITDLAFKVTDAVTGNGTPSGTFAQITPNVPGTYTYSYTVSATTLAGAAQGMGANELVVNASTGAVSSSGLQDNRIYTLTVTAAGHTETFRIFTGTNGADTMTGTAQDDIFFARGDGDTILAGAGDDTVFGQQGADIIKGGPGNDILTGGGGDDQFHFDSPLNAATNVDHITDFSPTGDLLYLSKAVFSGLATAAGPNPAGTVLQASDFLSVASNGGDAAAGGAHIIYDQATGNLYYDADGGSSANRTLFAVLDTKPTTGFDAGDFRVIA